MHSKAQTAKIRNHTLHPESIRRANTRIKNPKEYRLYKGTEMHSISLIEKSKADDTSPIILHQT